MWRRRCVHWSLARDQRTVIGRPVAKSLSNKGLCIALQKSCSVGKLAHPLPWLSGHTSIGKTRLKSWAARTMLSSEICEGMRHHLIWRGNWVRLLVCLHRRRDISVTRTTRTWVLRFVEPAPLSFIGLTPYLVVGGLAHAVCRLFPGKMLRS